MKTAQIKSYKFESFNRRHVGFEVTTNLTFVLKIECTATYLRANVPAICVVNGKRTWQLLARSLIFVAKQQIPKSRSAAQEN